MIEESSLDPQLHKQAIEAAITCKWENAIDLNQKILQFEPQNTEVLNRLAKAFFETGNYSQAKKVYTQVLEIDPYNTIAEKKLKESRVFKKRRR